MSKTYSSSVNGIQYTGNNIKAISAFTGEEIYIEKFNGKDYLFINNSNGKVRAPNLSGDYVIQDQFGEYYFCDSKTFEYKYGQINYDIELTVTPGARSNLLTWKANYVNTLVGSYIEIQIYRDETPIFKNSTITPNMTYTDNGGETGLTPKQYYSYKVVQTIMFDGMSYGSYTSNTAGGTPI